MWFNILSVTQLNLTIYKWYFLQKWIVLDQKGKEIYVTLTLMYMDVYEM